MLRAAWLWGLQRRLLSVRVGKWGGVGSLGETD